MRAVALAIAAALAGCAHMSEQDTYETKCVLAHRAGEAAVCDLAEKLCVTDQSWKGLNICKRKAYGANEHD